LFAFAFLFVIPQGSASVFAVILSEAKDPDEARTAQTAQPIFPTTLVVVRS
jgi:hypothetical protein